MPRYQFVTNLYQAFGLSFISVLSQDVPSDALLSAVGAVDRGHRRGARRSQVAELVEQNNRRAEIC